LNKVDTLAASAALGRLRDAGLLSQHGRGSATWYQPTEKLMGDHEGLSSMSGSLSSMSDPLSSKSRSLSSMSGPLSSMSNDRAEDPARSALLDTLPGQIAARVGAMGQRHPLEQVRDLIADLCQQRPWSVDELALLLRRNPESIRQNYLRPLLAEKRIAMTDPENPKSRQQAYRGVDGGKP
jgi:ATP-dependent DNA helicase RecG